MPADDSQAPDHPRPTVFLSYAREDRAAVLNIRDALPRFGLEVWYDESELLGGDAWDQKIRRQIRDCDFFMPVISAQTEARREGYFRREWRLAAERTLDMADDSVFVVPVVLDETGEAQARVPDRFRAVQWTRVPGGQPNAALEALCGRLVSREQPSPAPSGQFTAEPPRTKRRAAPPRGEFPEFPREEPGQKVRFWAQVIGWALQSVWAGFRRLPRWVRVLVYFWLAILILQRSFSSYTQPAVPASRTAAPSSTQVNKLTQVAKILRTVSDNSPGASAVNEAVQRLSTVTTAHADASAARAPILVIPFTAPHGDTRARRFTDTVFERLFGRLVLARPGEVVLSAVPLPSLDSAAALKQGRAHHSRYILYGGIGGHAPKLTLRVKILAAADGSAVWSKSYPVAGADPSRIASQTIAEVPKLGHD